MSAFLPNGSRFNVANGYAAAVIITAISNANPAVASATGHAYAEGDIIEIRSGWGKLDNRVLRVGAVTTDTFVLEGIDTTSTKKYPATGGAGTARKITAWAQLSQTTDSTSSGGEQNFEQFVYLEDGIQRQLGTFKNARSMQLQFADDPALAWYPTMEAADEDGVPRGVRLDLANGGIILYNVQISFDNQPSLTANSLMKVRATLSQQAEFKRYAD